MSTTIKEWCIVIGVLIAGIGVLIGLIFLLVWGDKKDKREFKENCSSIAKTIGVEEYHADGYDCYIVKDGKIVEIKL